MATAVNHVFHVAFGINGTDLTQVLLNQDFETAEKIILDSTVSSYLNEGAYQDTPLYIVLSQDYPVNFHIAKLLLRRGADLNLRVPQSSFGEYEDPGQTPLQLVVQLYCDVFLNSCLDRIANGFQCNVDIGTIYGSSKELISRRRDLAYEIRDLITVMLGYNADTNVQDGQGRTPLHHLLSSCCTDLRLIEMLCYHGADVNAKDHEQKTPLHYICDTGSHCHEKFCHKYKIHGQAREDQLSLLLSREEPLQLNFPCHADHTPLSLALANQHLNIATSLLENGASEAPYSGWCVRSDDYIERSIPAPLIGLVSAGEFWHDNTLFQPLNTTISSLVDKGYFTSSEVSDAFQEYVACEKQMYNLDYFKRVFEINWEHLVKLMFGDMSAGLRQSTVRKIVKTIFLLCQQKIDKYSDIPLQFFQYINEDFEPKLKDLHIPKNMWIYFQIELLRIYLTLTIGLYEVKVDDDRYSSEGDSDLEYW